MLPSVSKEALFATIPPERNCEPVPAQTKLIILDDDPTGTQTVHGIPVLTAWRVEDLIPEISDSAPCVFLLTNTRAFPPDRAAAINREIGENLARAAAVTGRNLGIVSRSDSTLRGHFPVETDALAAGLGHVIDGTLIIPAFFAGGRITVDDIHYVASGDVLVPAAATEFARDAVFGYRSSNLRDWVEEKTRGRVRASEVLALSLADLRTRPVAELTGKLLSLPQGGVAIVNAAAPCDLAALTHVLAHAEAAGRHYLYRTAADFVAVYAGITPRALLAPAELRAAETGAGGLLVAGSYVGKTSAQLAALFARCPELTRIEVDVARLLHEISAPLEIARCRQTTDAALAAGRSVALFTSRRLVTDGDSFHNLRIGETVSRALVAIVRGLTTRPSWFVSKGGITSSDLATHALGVRRAVVLGQALPGVPVWRTGPECKWPALPYVIFPGNVGGPSALAELIASIVLSADRPAGNPE